jgi:uncharacterized coiled-coil DUF342 family protein
LRTKEREDNEHGMRIEQVQGHLNTLEYKVAEVNQLVIMLENDRIEYLESIQQMKVKMVSMTEVEAQLDKEIEQLLGKAVNGENLRMLYEMDLKMLNQVNKGSANKFDGYVQHIVSTFLHLNS